MLWLLDNDIDIADQMHPQCVGVEQQGEVVEDNATKEQRCQTLLADSPVSELRPPQHCGCYHIIDISRADIYVLYPFHNIAAYHIAARLDVCV